jgi:hypothetical protein
MRPDINWDFVIRKLLSTEYRNRRIKRDEIRTAAPRARLADGENSEEEFPK